MRVRHDAIQIIVTEMLSLSQTVRYHLASYFKFLRHCIRPKDGQAIFETVELSEYSTLQQAQAFSQTTLILFHAAPVTET